MDVDVWWMAMFVLREGAMDFAYVEALFIFSEGKWLYSKAMLMICKKM
ncbi:MAG: hypothetical protein QM762_09885 [Chryseolinea sp.]